MVRGYLRDLLARLVADHYIGPTVKYTAAALHVLRAGALIAILGERSGSGAEILGEFGGRRQRR